ncbi:unnamed protein product, partial [Iphiclides podalirius]
MFQSSQQPSARSAPRRAIGGPLPGTASKAKVPSYRTKSPRDLRLTPPPPLPSPLTHSFSLSHPHPFGPVENSLPIRSTVHSVVSPLRAYALSRNGNEVQIETDNKQAV